MTDAQVVYVITAAGRIHKGAVIGDGVATSEACNVDDAAGERTIAFELPESASPETCCARCFPGEPS